MYARPNEVTSPSYKQYRVNSVELPVLDGVSPLCVSVAQVPREFLLILYAGLVFPNAERKIAIRHQIAIVVNYYGTLLVFAGLVSILC